MVIEYLCQVFNIKTISVGDTSKSHATDLRNSIKMETTSYTLWRRDSSIQSGFIVRRRTHDVVYVRHTLVTSIGLPKLSLRVIGYGAVRVLLRWAGEALPEHWRRLYCTTVVLSIVSGHGQAVTWFSSSRKVVFGSRGLLCSTRWDCGRSTAGYNW